MKVRERTFVILLITSSILAQSVRAQSLPRAIRESDLARFESVLLLSPAQREAVAAILRSADEGAQPDFQSQRKAMIKARETFQKLLARPETIPESKTALMMFKAMERSLSEYRNAVAGRDEQVFASVQEILTPLQSQEVPTLRLQLQRVALAQPLTAIREQNVDLIAICEKMGTLDGTEYAHVRAVTLATLPSFVQCLTNVARARDSVLELEAQVADAQRPFAISEVAPPPAVEAEVEELYRQWGKATLAESRQLVANNRSMLEQFCAGLTPEHAAEVRRLYDERAYPEIWPDPVAATDLFDTVRSIPDLDQEQRGFVADFERTYVDQHARLSRTMAKTVYERGLVWVKRDLDVAVQVGALNDELRRTGIEREKLNLRQREVLAAILLPHQIDAIPALKDAGEGDSKPPPRPWDVGSMTSKQSTTKPAGK